MQIAPKNLFRYHGDGAQWNAGLGEIVYKKLGWRTAALIGDDYSFAVDVSRRHHRRLLRHRRQDHEAGVDSAAARRATTRRTSDSCRRRTRWTATSGSSEVRNTSAALKAFEQAYGPVNAKQHSGNLFLYFLGADTTVAPRLVGAYMGGFGTFRGRLKTKQAPPT